MSDHEQKIKDLFPKIASDQCTEEEINMFFRLLKEVPAEEPALIKELDDWWQQLQDHPLPVAAERGIRIREIVQQGIMAAGKKVPASTYVIYRKKWLVAASVFLVSVTGTYFWMAHKKNPPIAAVPVKAVDIAPGQEGAILTLGNGARVVLDSLGNGVIATQNGARLVLKNRQLAYDATGKANKEVQYNTLSTPKGRQFRIQLPDGTNVWLNAASSVRYPTLFNGKERRVKVTGEAYFEVAKNATMPFKVNVNNQAEIEVLGTNFNINAYENEKSLKATLLAGTVRVVLNNSNAQSLKSPGAVVLKPGQQAQIAGEIKIVDKINTDGIVAWKEGTFNFDNVSIQDAMRQLERWYNIEVIYENGVPDIHFLGTLPRNLNLDDLLILLKQSKVHYRVEGNKLIVTK